MNLHLMDKCFVNNSNQNYKNYIYTEVSLLKIRIELFDDIPFGKD
jgi:hypothetical protein